MRRILEDIPSIPRIPSIAPLHLGITTRVMAKKLAQNKEEIAELKKNPKEKDVVRHRRRSSKFLEGATIPNSIIKADIGSTESAEQKDIDNKQDREEFVEKLMKRLQPQKKMHHSIYDEDVDREALNKIKKELQRRSLLPLHSEDEVDKKSISTVSNNNNDKSIKDPWEELKEKRRISRRTSILAPLNGEKRPTYESIKKAIQNSKIIQQLLDADNIEQQKIKQIQTGRSLLTNEMKENIAVPHQASLPGSPTLNIKVPKRDSIKVKEKKVPKKRPSLKSDKVFGASINEKSVKQKSSLESKKFIRKSTNSKMFKDELQRFSTSISNNAVTKQRKPTR
ncbi:hypothetical protein ILUMI_01490 [Ignelater luminosus]|uniref:Uncharacterized protein n=1 Tax=Ignelater luminosus TaxID=2038154 RepID=A0A8K0DIF6_IGNLU|nr:hypothetical protein ILUMI_01490 [Ignelater luminosus]